MKAALKGNLESLKYAYENSCPWDELTIEYATTEECYDYAVAHGCPGSQLSRFHDPADDDDDDDDETSHDPFVWTSDQQAVAIDWAGGEGGL